MQVLRFSLHVVRSVGLQRVNCSENVVFLRCFEWRVNVCFQLLLF